MSYNEHDAALDAMYEQIGQELYPIHKAQAISEFTAERLRSYYVSNSKVMLPALEAYKEGKRLNSGKHYSAAVVFFASSVELFLKATVLKPVVHGLIHSEGLANIIAQHALGQTGFSRYTELLAELFDELAEIKLKDISRSGAAEALFAELAALQKMRNDVIHQGSVCTEERAYLGLLISEAVYERIVSPLLCALGLAINEKGFIEQT